MYRLGSTVIMMKGIDSDVAKMKNLFTIISYKISLLINRREDPGRCHINN